MLNKKNFLLRLLDNKAIVSILVVLLGFIVGTILVILVGKDPANMYKAIWYSIVGKVNSRGVWNTRYIGETLAFSIPFILCGLSMAFAARVGLFNIGGEGQYIIGMTAAQTAALFLPQFPGQWIVCLLCAIIAGSIWGGIVGFFKAKYSVSEVVATIMMNYIALYVSRLICFTHPGATTYKTEALGELSLIPKFLIKSSSLNYGLFFAIFSVIIFYIVMEKTKLGFSLRATGFNKEASRCSGISVVKSIFISMAFAGAFAGLAGGIVLLGGSFQSGRIISGMDNYGFNGIAVALVGNNTAIGTLLAGILFGILKQAQSLMQGMNIPKEITFIIQGLIVVFIALRSAVEIYKQYMNKKALQVEVTKK